MTEYYECHITMRGKREDISPVVESEEWKFSCIDGDPVLGKEIFCYATRHYSAVRVPLEEVVMHMNIAALVFHKVGIEIVRQKVELVVYDTKMPMLIPVPPKQDLH